MCFSFFFFLVWELIIRGLATFILSVGAFSFSLDFMSHGLKLEMDMNTPCFQMLLLY